MNLDFLSNIWCEKVFFSFLCYIKQGQGRLANICGLFPRRPIETVFSNFSEINITLLEHGSTLHLKSMLTRICIALHPLPSFPDFSLFAGLGMP